MNRTVLIDICRKFDFVASESIKIFPLSDITSLLEAGKLLKEIPEESLYPLDAKGANDKFPEEGLDSSISPSKAVEYWY